MTSAIALVKAQKTAEAVFYRVHEDIILPLQAAMTVFLAAATIGFIDDIGLLSRRQKAALVIFAVAGEQRLA